MATSIRKYQIFVVDDHPIIREGLMARIASTADLAVCGEAGSVSETLQALQEIHPDLILIDVSLKNESGLDLVKQLHERHPKLKILIISAYDETLFAERALRAGAMGYLNKQESREKVLEAIHTVLDGKRYMSQQILERLVGQAVGDRIVGPLSPVEKLTDRELQIFQLIGKGITSKAIAKQLHLSSHTIDTHREKIKHKLELKNGTELTQHAVQWVLENT